MRAAGHARLFPELGRARRGSYSGRFQRWANRCLDRAGAKGDRQSFHSTRHTFTDALRRAGATGEVIDGMLGWSRGNMRDRYGSGPWIMMLAEVMQGVSILASISATSMCDDRHGRGAVANERLRAVHLAALRPASGASSHAIRSPGWYEGALLGGPQGSRIAPAAPCAAAPLRSDWRSLC
jgi:hypothetical protein